MTLQIAWSGVLPPHPVVFPTLPQARFMAYDAVVHGARGLFFFGGQFKQVMNAADRKRGWNWTYWREVQRPLVEELSDAAHMAALTAPLAALPIRANAADIALSARAAGAVALPDRRSPKPDRRQGGFASPGCRPGYVAAPCSRIRAGTPPGTSRSHAARSPTRIPTGRTTHASTASRSPAERPQPPSTLSAAADGSGSGSRVIRKPLKRPSSAASSGMIKAIWSASASPAY